MATLVVTVFTGGRLEALDCATPTVGAGLFKCVTTMIAGEEDAPVELELAPSGPGKLDGSTSGALAEGKLGEDEDTD